MNWPTSQDYNEAVQNPSSFGDPSLQSGGAVLDAAGWPLRRRGAFADVYKYKDGDGKIWGLKFFTQNGSGLAERYKQIGEHFDEAKFPFTVGFDWLQKGIRVGGEWFPLLKIEWAEGNCLNEWVREHADEPDRLQTLLNAWRLVCANMRDSGVAHGDLEHGNVLLASGAEPEQLELKLVDYDGVYLHVLAEQHAGEVGHANYQHPFRVRDRNYGPDIDRFPHLVIAAALRATILRGRALWDEFDNGDNLLFTAEDLRDPDSSRVFKSLRQINDALLNRLLEHLARASKEPLRKTPWLDDLLGDDAQKAPNLEPTKPAKSQGVAPRAKVSDVATLDESRRAKRIEDDDDDDDDSEPFRRRPDREPATRKRPAERDRKSTSRPTVDRPNRRWGYLLAGGVVVVAFAVGIVALTRDRSKNDPTTVAQTPTSDEKPSIPALVENQGSNAAKTDSPSVDKKDPPVVDKKDPPPPPVDKKDPPPVDKKGPLIVDAPPPPIVQRPKIELTPPEFRKLNGGDGNAEGKLSLGWKTKPGTGMGGVVFAEDGKRLHIVDAKRFRTLNVADGRVVEDTKLSDQLTYRPVLGPNQVLLTTEMRSRRMTAWDLAKKSRLYEMLLPSAYPPTVNWGEGIFMAANDKQIAVYSLKDGKPIRTMKMPIVVYEVAITPDGGTIAAFGGWGLAAKRPDQPEFKVIEEFPPGGSYSMSLAADGKSLALYRSQMAGIRLHDLTGNVPPKLLNEPDAVAIVFTRDSRQLLTVSRHGQLRLWDVASAHAIAELQLTLGHVTGLALSPDGRSAAAYGTEAVQIVHLGDGKAPNVVAKERPPALVKEKPREVIPEDPAFAFKELWKKPAAGIRGLAITPDGKQIALQTTQTDIQYFDLAKGNKLDKLTPGTRSFNNMLLGADGVLIAYRPPGELVYWERQGGKARWTIDEQPIEPMYKTIAVKGKLVLMAQKQGQFGIYSLVDGKLIERVVLPFNGPVWALSCTDDGEAILVGLPTNAMFFRASKKSEFKRLANLSFQGGNYPALHLAPDARHYMQFSPVDPNIRLYKAATGEAHVVMNSPSNLRHALFTPDGQYVLSVSADATMRLWSVATGKEVARKTLPDELRRFALSPDGRIVVTTVGPFGDMQAWSMPDAVKPSAVVLAKASPARIKLEGAKKGYLDEIAKCRKASDEHFEQREAAALKNKMLSMLDQIETERKDVDAATGLPKTSPQEAAKKAAAAIVAMETAFATAVKECAETTKDEAAAVGKEFDEFKRTRTVRLLKFAP